MCRSTADRQSRPSAPSRCRSWAHNHGCGVSGGGQWLVLAPVTERGEAIGVLELTLPGRPDAADVAQVARLAHVLAFVVIANRRHTDLYEWGQRSRR